MNNRLALGLVLLPLGAACTAYADGAVKPQAPASPPPAQPATEPSVLPDRSLVGDAASLAFVET